jgi:hypothetical protein
MLIAIIQVSDSAWQKNNSASKEHKTVEVICVKKMILLLSNLSAATPPNHAKLAVMKNGSPTINPTHASECVSLWTHHF